MPGPDATFLTTVTVPDGSAIAVYDFGGEGPELLLAHATGFHAHVLGRLAAALSGRFRCYGVDLRGHGRSVAAASWDGDWGAFGGDLLAVVDELGLERPLGFGHSCGGASLLLAEEARPGTFAQLYTFEPVVTPTDDPPPPNYENPLSVGALRRREVFGSLAEAESNYAAKPPLSAIAPEILHDYVVHGFETLADGSVRLRCRGATEASVYAHGMSHTAYRDLARVKCPVSLAYGEATADFGAAELGAMRARLVRAEVEGFPGLGHFGPLSDPAAIAASIVRVAETAAR